MVKEIHKCESCDRTFRGDDAFAMHNKAKHSEKIKKEKTSLPLKKIKNWAIFIVIIGLALWGIIYLIQGVSPVGSDYSKAITLMGAEHVSVGRELPEYTSNPPTSGPHYDTPAKPGFRESEIADGHLIHSIEHGLVWVSYHPRIGVESEKLRSITNPMVVITPREANDADIAIASWGRLDTFNLEDGAIDEDDLRRINDFVLRYNNKGPESLPPGQHGGI